MIISEQAFVTWYYNNRRYYEEKGYKFSKYGDKFLVSVSDLSPGSRTWIKLKCDVCGFEYERQYYSYIESVLRNEDTGNSILCKHCNMKRDRRDRSFYEEEFAKRGYVLLEGQNSIRVHVKVKYICKKHEYMGEQEITYGNLSQGKGCYYCGIEKQAASRSGENSNWWNGGTTEFNAALRSWLKPWIRESIERCDGKCVITNSTKTQLHHLVSFDTIAIRTMEELNLPVYSDLSNYSIEEKKKIKHKLLESHFKYGLGVCVRRDLHKVFHKINGKRNNTPEQFTQFTQWYHAGGYERMLKLRPFWGRRLLANEGIVDECNTYL